MIYNMINGSKTPKDMSVISRKLLILPFLFGRVLFLSAKPPFSNATTAAATTTAAVAAATTVCPLALCTVAKTNWTY